MISDPIEGRVFQLFAELLTYPRANLAGAAGECAALVAPRSAEAAAALREFESLAEKTPLTRMEEIYTGVFELDAICHPYIGYHLFGESYKRSSFLLSLKERYRPWNIQCGAELPDHLSIILRFLAVNQDPAEAVELIREALHPALRKMLKARDEEPPELDLPKPPARGDEYRHVLLALRSVLLGLVPDDTPQKEEMPVDNLSLAAADWPGGYENA